MKTIPVILLCIVFFFRYGTSQEVISNAGECFHKENIQLSWTLGEPCIETFSNNGRILTEGFQQGKISISPVDLDPLQEITGLKIYPNPVGEKLVIDYAGLAEQSFMYKICDVNGKTLSAGRITDPLFFIDMSFYTQGEYLLMIFNLNDKLMKSYIIIK